MNNSFRSHLSFAVVLLLNARSIQIFGQTSIEGAFPADFMKLLKSIEPHHFMKKTTLSAVKEYYDNESITPRARTLRKKDNAINGQKAALRDVLMLKLVSYYENKYKISHHEPKTLRPRHGGHQSISERILKQNLTKPAKELRDLRKPRTSMKNVSAEYKSQWSTGNRMIPRRTFEINKNTIYPTIAEVVVL